jgi:hypothetical protein
VEQMVVTEPIVGDQPVVVPQPRTAARGTCRQRSSYSINAMHWRW